MHVFLSHASEDKAAVRKLAQRLREDGFDPWLDEDRLLPGKDWDAEILAAVHAADAIVVCLSATSVNKVGYVQKELRRVLDAAEHQPEHRTFVIPVRLEDCAIPTRFSQWQYADLFEPGGYERLRAGLESAASPDPALAAVPRRRRISTRLVVGGLAIVVALAGAELYRRLGQPGSNQPSQPAAIPAPAGMVVIPGGRFLMGRNGIERSSPAHEVTVARFFLDRVPVTVAQYREFTRADSSPGRDDLPVTDITWDEAFAYCAAQEKRLPTEAEWEFAARGPTGLLYPWGEQYLADAVNSRESGIGHKEPVGFRPRNRSLFGVADLSGNVWQWCVDDYRPYPGGTAGFAIPAGAKVIRGGSFRADASQVTAVARNLEQPATRSPVIGFRCAK